MKQLKFMLAAATAIGLATASQAAEQTNKLVDNENFDAIDAGTAATEITGYSYDGATAADNESVVKAGGYGDTGNALQVNTGTDPLLRALSQMSTAQALDLASYKSVYIDTMVQFTVTPYGDEVEAGEDDKLMIYLKECLGSVNDDGSTNFVNKLMVKAAEFAPADELDPESGKHNPVDVAVTAEGLTVEPNNWYNLKVSVALEQNIPVFTIQIDGKTLASSQLLMAGDTTGTKFPSLVKNTTLTYVGFAGEGLVDNLTVATVTEVTSLDFTFSWSDEGISGVTYTIGEAAPVAITSGVKFSVEPNTTFTLNVALKDWYKLAAGTVLEYANVTAGASAELTAVKTANVDDDGNVTVTENTTATDLGIAADSAFAAAETAVLNKLMTWATASAKGSAGTAAKAAALVNRMTFDGVTPTSDEAKAYLLDCAINAIETAKEEFKLTISFDENGAPVVEGPDGAATYKNGKIVLKGRASLSEGDWGPKAAGHKFFKAVLTK